MSYSSALMSYDAYKTRSICAVWKKILWTLPHVVQVQVIHWLVISKEPAITLMSNSWKRFYRSTWMTVMCHVRLDTFPIALKLDCEEMNSSSVIVRGPDYWSICIDPSSCLLEHKTLKRKYIDVF